MMSIEQKRRYKKRAKGTKDKKDKKDKKTRGLNPKKDLSTDEIEARKKAQRMSMFDKKKNLYKK